MGSAWSSHVSESSECSDPRPCVSYASLQSFDLVLIRSQVQISGSDLPIPARVASTIRCGALGMQLPVEQHLATWDRVGLIQLPSFIEPHQYSADTIEVCEATYTGIQTRTMRQVMEEAEEVCVRRVIIRAQEEQEEKERIERDEARRNGGRFSQRHRRGRTGALSFGGGLLSSIGGLLSGSRMFDDSSLSSSSHEIRLPFVNKYYQYSGPVVNRPYGSCMDKLESMFKGVLSALRRCELNADELERMNAIIQRYVETYRTADGREGSGIPFHSLLPLCREIASSGCLNTFSDSEMVELVGSFSVGDDRVTLSHSGHLTAAEFMSQWRSSLDRSQSLRRLTREILSGAFVTSALRAMDVLPKEENERIYMPMDFAMHAPTQEGGEGAEMGRINKKGAKWLEKEKEERKRLEEEEAQLDTHVPQVTQPPSIAPYPVHASASARSPSRFSSPSPRSATSVSIPSFACDGSVEGAAIVRIHAHGIARIGIEQKLPRPTNLADKEDDMVIGR